MSAAWRIVTVPSNQDRRARPSASIAAKEARNAAVSMPFSWPWERVSSTRKSVFSMPQADSTDAATGTTTRPMPSSAATAETCSPAAPPKASSV